MFRSRVFLTTIICILFQYLALCAKNDFECILIGPALYICGPIVYMYMNKYVNGPALVAQGVSTRRTGHILEALLPQGELRE